MNPSVVSFVPAVAPVTKPVVAPVTKPVVAPVARQPIRKTPSPIAPVARQPIRKTPSPIAPIARQPIIKTPSPVKTPSPRFQHASRKAVLYRNPAQKRFNTPRTTPKNVKVPFMVYAALLQETALAWRLIIPKKRGQDGSICLSSVTADAKNGNCRAAIWWSLMNMFGEDAKTTTKEVDMIEVHFDYEKKASYWVAIVRDLSTEFYRPGGRHNEKYFAGNAGFMIGELKLGKSKVMATRNGWKCDEEIDRCIQYYQEHIAKCARMNRFMEMSHQPY